MNLSIRLNCALNWIDSSNIVADVGCDHGYLAKAALLKGVKHVQLIDNKIGPLTKAKDNLKEYLDSTYTTFTLASGLTMLEDNIDTVCMLGMGGYLIRDLLIEGKDKIKLNQRFILEANNHIDSLREYLFTNGFTIIDEAICKDNKKHYELILCTKSNDDIKYSKEDLVFGPILRIKKSSVYLEKWNNILEYYENINKDKNILEIDEKIKFIKENI